MSNVNQQFLNTVRKLLQDGQDVTCRGLRTKELMGHQTKIDMSRPILTIPERNLGYKFLVAEAAWIMSGDNRVATIEPYSPHIKKFSDDGERYFGSYGPKIVDQLSYIVDTLAKDNYSRQAYMNIWREQPRPTKDIPCTIGLQWLIRDGKLHCFDTMRSSDIWLGWPYDIFNMSMISIGICVMLRTLHNIDVELGDLTLTATSQHLYEINFLNVSKLNLQDKVEYDVPIPINPKAFISYQHVVDTLRFISNLNKQDAYTCLLSNQKIVTGVR